MNRFTRSEETSEQMLNVRKKVQQVEKWEAKVKRQEKKLPCDRFRNYPSPNRAATSS